MAEVRRNGFQGPVDFVTVSAWLFQTASAAVFATLVGLTLHADLLAGSLGSWVPTVVLTAILWLYCQGVDPSKDGGVGMSCMREAQAVVKYCSQCKKQVPGLDHHCAWLNTCVGKKNYFQFYLLSCFGTLSSLIQFGWSIVVVADGETREQGFEQLDVGLYVLVGLSLLLSLTLFVSYVSLWAFHTYLLYVGQTTYMYMVEQNKQRVRARQVEQDQEKTTATTV